VVTHRQTASSSSVKTKRGGFVNSPDRHLISLVVQQSYYGLRVEAVKELYGPILGAPVTLAMQQQREQSMTRVTGV
jgi:hypothetical protein